MECEGQGKREEAHDLFARAWNESTTNFERFTAAHYVARHQPTVEDKLVWDKLSRQHALHIADGSASGACPSLYLNVAKGYEDLGDFDNARKHYELGQTHLDSLPDDGYGKLIRGGIHNGLQRLRQQKRARQSSLRPPSAGIPRSGKDLL